MSRTSSPRAATRSAACGAHLVADRAAGRTASHPRATLHVIVTATCRRTRSIAPSRCRARSTARSGIRCGRTSTSRPRFRSRPGSRLRDGGAGGACAARPAFAAPRLHRLGARHRRAGDDRSARRGRVDPRGRQEQHHLPRRDDPRRLRRAAVPLARGPGGRARRDARRRSGPAAARRAVEGIVPARPRDLRPRVSLPRPGVHRQPRQSPGDALPRRHPQHHGAGDCRRGTGVGDRAVRTPCAWRCSRR